MADSERFDGLYLTLAQQAGSIENIFESFFGFLHRKTDFYVGAGSKKETFTKIETAFEKYYNQAQVKKEGQAEANRKVLFVGIIC